MKQIKIGWVEAQEIAEAILKIENNDDDTSLVEEALAEKMEHWIRCLSRNCTGIM